MYVVAQNGLYPIGADNTPGALERRLAARAMDVYADKHKPEGDNPVAITPGQDDLSFYPLLYWPITADAGPTPEAIAALNEFTSRGGIILIDTRDGGTGEGFAPGTEAALRRVSTGLAVPPLAPLTSDHVLARAFYLLQEFPGPGSDPAVPPVLTA